MDIYVKELKAAAEFIRSRDPRCPKTAIILGSGLGALADKIQSATVIPYAEIPGFPISTAVGHKGNLIIGELAGKCILAMQGRFHYYEGYTMRQVTFPIRVMSLLGIKYLFVSNAAGGLNTDYKVGDLMLIRDHINMAPNPLIGPNLDEFGPRFPDMGKAYSPNLNNLAKKAASELQIPIREGIYITVTGPTYETPAECRCYARMGGDAIGMSTVAEVIVAHQCGIEVMGMSVITDPAHYDRDDDFSINADEVVAAADAAAGRMSAIFTSVISEIEA